MSAFDTGDRLLRRTALAGGGWTATLAAVALLGATAELLLPAALGHAVDTALTGGSGWWTACALVLVLICVDTLSDLATGLGAARATAGLRRHLLRHLFALDVRATRRHPVGDLVGRLVSQAADAGQAGNALVLATVAVLPPLGSVAALTIIHPALGITLLAGLGLLTVLMRAFVTDASTASANYQRVLGGIAGRLLESLHGARTIAAAATTHHEQQRILADLPTLNRYGHRAWTLLATASARTAAVAPLLHLSVIAVGGYALTANWLTPGQLVAAIRYAALGAGLGGVLATLNHLVRSRAGAHRIADVLAQPAAPTGTRPLPPGGGALQLRAVSVHNDGRRILDRIDLDIPAGATVAVVGTSGAGKSTLAAVAGRLHDPDTGDVRLDGVPLRHLDPTALRRAVGYAFDRPVLIGATIHDAIGLALPTETATPPPEPTPATPAVLTATRAAAVADVVEQLPNGYRTPLTHTPLSGGETQRLGLARAFTADRLLILDDATSNLDTATEHRITQATTARTDHRTRLLITHRAATAAAADLVAWLHTGRLRGLAPHHHLWADPEYRAVFTPTSRTP
ncbi:ABC transporter ATP-binding protein [Micromonospora chokoriensis]